MKGKEKLVLGFIGNGKSANRYHLPYILNRRKTINVKAVYMRTLRDNGWARIPGVDYTDDLQKILKDPEIHEVVVSTTTESHFKMAKKVLEAGKHCIVEKPFATSLKEATELFRLAEEKGVTVECYQNRRFDSDFLTAKKILASGKLGEVYEINMHYDYYRPNVPEGEKDFNIANAFLYTHACHTVDQVISWFGKPESVHADVRQLLGKGRMNDYFDLDLMYPGLKVSVKSSYFRAKARPSFELYGRRGVFIKEEQDRQESDLKKFYLPEGHDDFGMDLPEHYGTLIYYDDNGVYHEEKVVSELGDYARYYDALYETILHGAPPLVKEEETMEQMRILAEAAGKLS